MWKSVSFMTSLCGRMQLKAELMLIINRFHTWSRWQKTVWSASVTALFVNLFGQ